MAMTMLPSWKAIASPQMMAAAPDCDCHPQTVMRVDDGGMTQAFESPVIKPQDKAGIESPMGMNNERE
jgi:hypothetical protein